jgi:hypothetical protein
MTREYSSIPCQYIHIHVNPLQTKHALNQKLTPQDKHHNKTITMTQGPKVNNIYAMHPHYHMRKASQLAKITPSSSVKTSTMSGSMTPNPPYGLLQSTNKG